MWQKLSRKVKKSEIPRRSKLEVDGGNAENLSLVHVLVATMYTFSDFLKKINVENLLSIIKDRIL